MSYGLKDTDIRLIVHVLAQFPHIEKVILHGSRAKGSYRASSDVNLALAGKKLDAAALTIVLAKLNDLLLPYTFDLLLYDRISNYNLVDHIDETGIRFYTRRPVKRRQKAEMHRQ